MNNRIDQFIAIATKDGAVNAQKLAELIVLDCIAQCDIAAANSAAGYSDDFITGYKVGVGKCYYKIKATYGLTDK